MPRSLTAGLQASTAKQFTNPIHLITQDMGASVIRSSTRELIDFLGNDYNPNGAAVETYSEDSFSWSLDNSDRSISIMALGNDVGGNTVSMGIYYEGEFQELFTGVIDEWFTRGQRVIFRATSQAAKQQKFPGDRAENGVFNHLPTAGSNIMWGQQSIILSSEPN